jgi:hypothetical protein
MRTAALYRTLGGKLSAATVIPTGKEMPAVQDPWTVKSRGNVLSGPDCSVNPRIRSERGWWIWSPSMKQYRCIQSVGCWFGKEVAVGCGIIGKHGLGEGVDG